MSEQSAETQHDAGSRRRRREQERLTALAPHSADASTPQRSGHPAAPVGRTAPPPARPAPAPAAPRDAAAPPTRPVAVQPTPPAVAERTPPAAAQPTPAAADRPLSRRELRERAEALAAALQQHEAGDAGATAAPEPPRVVASAETTQPLSRRQLRAAASGEIGSRPVSQVQPPAVTGSMRRVSTGELAQVQAAPTRSTPQPASRRANRLGSSGSAEGNASLTSPEARAAAVKVQAARAHAEREEQARLNAERAHAQREAQRVSQEQAATGRAARARALQERAVQERAVQEQAAQEQAEREGAARARAEQEQALLRAAQQRAEEQRSARAQAEQVRAEQLRVEQDRVEKDRLEKDRLEQDRIEQDRAQRQQAELERTEHERAGQERATAERADAARAVLAQAAAERAARAKAAQDEAADVRTGEEQATRDKAALDKAEQQAQQRAVQEAAARQVATQQRSTQQRPTQRSGPDEGSRRSAPDQTSDRPAAISAPVPGWQGALVTEGSADLTAPLTAAMLGRPTSSPAGPTTGWPAVTSGATGSGRSDTLPGRSPETVGRVVVVPTGSTPTIGEPFGSITLPPTKAGQVAGAVPAWGDVTAPSGWSPAPGASAPSEDRVEPADAAPVGTAASPAPQHDQVRPYSWVHMIVLVLVAFVLGMLIYLVVINDAPPAAGAVPAGQTQTTGAAPLTPTEKTDPTGE